MKKLLSLIAIVFVFQAKSQITITSSSMPGSGDTLRYSSSAPAGVIYAPTGANYFWDYSNLTMVRQDLYEYKSAPSTPYAFYFIGLNKFGLKMADSIGVGTFQFKDVYNFFQKTSTVFKTEGIGFKYNNIPLAGYFSDDDELYQFPLNYLDRDSSNFAFSVSIGTGISYAQRGYRINEVDGWGSIKTPYDSVACLRLISTSYGIDSINFNGFGFSFPNIQRSYKWLSTTEKIPVLEISGQYQNNNFNATQVRYRDMYRSLVGLQTLDNTNESVIYPNPSNGLFTVYLTENKSGEMSIVDLNGKSVYTSNCNAGKNSIDLNALNLSKGVYLISVLDDTKTIVLQKKLIIE
jgi:hypothetical protein